MARRLLRRHQRHELTDSQYWELLLGPARESAFTEEADRLNAWREHGADLKAGWPGRLNPLWGEITYDGATPPDWHGKPLA